MPEQVKVERDGRVLVATLDNPPHAFMTRTMVEELDEVVREADADDGIGAVVLTGSHPDRFITHYDVAEILAGVEASPALSPGGVAAVTRAVGALGAVPGAKGALRRTPAAGILELQRFHDMLALMERSGAVHIVAINGSAGGGGCELSWACDIRLMSEGTNDALAQPEILLGFPPGAGGTQRLPRLIGTAAALEWILEGRRVDAAEARRLGLVHHTVPAERLMEEATAIAGRLSRRSKPAVRAIKRAVNEGGSLPFPAGMRIERAGFLATAASQPAMRAMRAYVEFLEREGEVPAYDEGARERLLAGTFVDMNAP